MRRPAITASGVSITGWSSFNCSAMGRHEIVATAKKTIAAST
jgi:hypothetical protein